jgi:deazaflavin-dependent oxidoreductase (nitroreductase family)
MARIPGFVRLFDPLARRLLARGLPMGPNTILTVPGRRSGLPRQFAVAIVELDGRRWVVGAFGESHWVRNLRAAARGTIRVDGRHLDVHAHELAPTEAEAFFREVMPRYLRAMPLPARSFVSLFIRVAAPQLLTDPAAFAATRPVFELTPG